MAEREEPDTLALELARAVERQRALAAEDAPSSWRRQNGQSNGNGSIATGISSAEPVGLNAPAAADGHADRDHSTRWSDASRNSRSRWTD